tara:strand:+ start:262 stop:495 length:234 start_codon:yes stop_codon:yes gene_type:complete
MTLNPELVEKKEPPRITSTRKIKPRLLGTCSNEIPILETLLEIETNIFKKLLSKLKNINDKAITIKRYIKMLISSLK